MSVNGKNLDNYKQAQFNHSLKDGDFLRKMLKNEALQKAEIISLT
jgi:hypothetical protein